MWTAMSKMAICICLFVSLLVVAVADDSSTAIVNAITDGGYGVTIPTKCAIEFKQPDVKLYWKLTETDNRLVYVHFNFTNHTGKLLHGNHGDLFEPLTWVHVSGHQGEMLLNLLYHFEALSLQTMSIGVKHVTIDITESPPGCLTNQPMEAVGQYFRDTILNNFGTSTDYNVSHYSIESEGESTEESISVSVCHMTIGRDDSVARFFYTCCYHNKHGTPVCKELMVDSYMQVVMLLIVVLNILVIAFSPFLVPEYYYSDTNGYIRYQQDSNTERQPIKIIKTSVPKQSGSRANIVTEKLVKEFMPKFSKTVKKIKRDKPIDCDIGTIEFLVKSRDLISESDVPVGIFSTIYNNFARCEIRHHSLIMDCCNAEMCTRSCCSVRWHECLSRLMASILLGLVSIPWIFRVMFYIMYERDHFEGRSIAAESRQLETPYLANLSLYLSPLHAVFLVCYFAIIIESMCLGILHKNVTRSLRLLFRKCFQDMRSSARSKIINKLWDCLLYPCTKYGIFGLIIFPLVWVFVLPVFLVVATFYYLPVVNLTFRLIVSLLHNMIPTNTMMDACRGLNKRRKLNIYEWEAAPSGGLICLRKLRHVLMTVFCLMALYSFLFLLVEFVQFVVVVVIYTTMGVILNSSFAMQYVPLLFMIAVYGHLTFGGVYAKYMSFNKIIHKHTIDILKNSNTQIGLLNVYANTAFELSPETMEDPHKDTLYVKNSYITWLSKRTVLFMDEHGTPYIRGKFFFECCEMDHYAAPGGLFKNLMKAVFRFFVIICFLVFVGLVVVAFSENFKLSGTNQTLITLAGGLIPFVLTNFLFREVELPAVEKDDFRFRNSLYDRIFRYREEFEVFDFKCITALDDETVTNSDSGKDSDTGSQGDPTSQPSRITSKAGTGCQVTNTVEDNLEMSSDNLRGSSPDLDSVTQHEVDLHEKNLEQSIDGLDDENNEMPRSEKQSEEQKTEDLDTEVINELHSEHSITNDTLPKRRTKREQDYFKTFNLQEYDIVINTRRPRTTTEYLISLI